LIKTDIKLVIIVFFFEVREHSWLNYLILCILFLGYIIIESENESIRFIVYKILGLLSEDESFNADIHEEEIRDNYAQIYNTAGLFEESLEDALKNYKKKTNIYLKKKNLDRNNYSKYLFY
jgi:hypothetical protein